MQSCYCTVGGAEPSHESMYVQSSCVPSYMQNYYRQNKQTQVCRKHGKYAPNKRKGTVMNSFRSFPSAVRRGVPSGNCIVNACGNWPVGFAFFKVSFLPVRIRRAPWQATSPRNVNFMALIAKAASVDSFSTKESKLKGSRSRIAVK